MVQIEERAAGQAAVLMVSGDITMGGGSRVSEAVRALLRDGRYHVLLDMTRVRYVDSVGLGELVEAFAAAKNRGGALKLVHVGRRLRDLLVVSRMLTVFDAYDSEDDALASFTRHPPPPR
jgi:anti-sigma B factor antagonist